jgi:hypothetical protein
MATPRGRWFLTAYAARNRHADTRTLMAALARLEAALGGAPPLVRAGEGHLIEIAAAIDRIRSELAPPAPMPDPSAVLDRLQHTAFALRDRDADAALCDALDAAIREVRALWARSETGFASAEAAGQLLAALTDRIGEMLAPPSANIPPVNKAAAPPPKLRSPTQPSSAAPAAAAPISTAAGPEDDPGDLFGPLEHVPAPPSRSDAAPPPPPIAHAADSLPAVRVLSAAEMIALFS